MTRAAALILALFAGTATGVHAADSVPASHRLSFGIYRNGERIGARTLAFKRNGETLTVESTVEVAVKLFFVTVYRLSESKREVWRAGEVVEFDAAIDDNGAKSEVRARRREKGLSVEGPAGATEAPADAAPSTYWNEAAVRRGRLFDSSTGETLEIRIARLPDGKPLAPDGTARVRRYRMTGGLERDLFYDLNGIWTGLRMTARDGSVIEYRRD